MYVFLNNFSQQTQACIKLVSPNVKKIIMLDSPGIEKLNFSKFGNFPPSPGVTSKFWGTYIVPCGREEHLFLSHLSIETVNISTGIQLMVHMGCY